MTIRSIPFAAAFVLLLAMPAAFAQTLVATVTGLAGEATAQRGGTVITLDIGTRLMAGDTILTESGARVGIELDDGTRLVIGAASELILPEPRAAESGALQLLIGVARIVVGPAVRTGGPEVATRTAVASVRSTDWIVEALDGSTGVFVLEGEVAVTDLGGTATVVVPPGLGTNVAAGQPPTEPAPWGAARVRSVIARTAPL